MPEKHSKYDDILWTIATQSGGVTDFLNVIASFLKRRTDFFSGTTNDRWEKLLLNIFQQVSKEESDKHPNRDGESRESPSNSSIDVSIKSGPSLPKEVQSSRWQTPHHKSTFHAISVDDNDNDDNKNPLAIGNQEEEEISKPIEIATDATTAIDDDVGKLMPNAGNGCTLANYSWQQTLGEIELKIPLRVAQPLRSRDVNVNITKKSMVVGIKGQRPIIDGELCEEIKPDETTWVLQDGALVYITLEKMKKNNWWDRLIMSDPVIAIRKIEPELSKLSDLDGSARATVEKMLYDQRTKKCGLPPSKVDKEKMEVLERFKKIHPELDFSRCKY